MKIEVSQAERAILYVDGQASEVLGPGKHARLALFKRLHVLKLPLLQPLLNFPEAEILASDPKVGSAFRLVRIGDRERGLMFRGDNLVQVLMPGVHVLLADATQYRIDVVKVEDGISETLRARLPSGSPVKSFSVPLGHKAIKTYDNVIQPGLVEPGMYTFWIGTPDVNMVIFDLREQTHEIQGQELMTQDKVSLRLNLSTRLQVTDPLKAATSQSNWKDAVYRELQLALRLEVAALTLDELLAKKEELGAAIKTRVDVSPFGVTLLATGVRDIILPGEMRTILNQVIEAEKRAAANLIARREEIAATRNLMNTAKMLESNPTLMRLKELEAAERIADKIQNLSVYGGLDAFIGMVKNAP